MTEGGPAYRPDLDWSAHFGEACLNWPSALADASGGAIASLESIEQRARARLHSLIAFARERSSYYRELYRGLGDTPELEALPVTTRRASAARFDDWVTDPAVRIGTIQRFLEDHTLVGHAYLGRYAVWQSSGTTGEPGVFVQDADALERYDALDSIRLGSGMLGPACALSMIALGARYAMIGVTAGHYAGAASVERLRLLQPMLADRLRVISAFEPLSRIVSALNEWQPAFVATYPSVAAMLARERRAGTLHIAPAGFWLGGENLSSAQRTQIRDAFDCPVLEQYGASECMSIASECARGTLHLNADWVILEPVDRHHRPVPPGVMSHTVLLTNLANRVQPIIRYDLGDSVRFATQPCACGSSLPAMQVIGRTDEIVHARAPGGDRVDLPPIALTTIVETHTDGRPFQIVQTGPERLALRISDDARWRTAERALRAYLDGQALPNVAIEHDARPIATNPRSGKLQHVITATAETGDQSGERDDCRTRRAR